jgi:hypothetical protein
MDAALAYLISIGIVGFGGWSVAISKFNPAYSRFGSSSTLLASQGEYFGRVGPHRRSRWHAKAPGSAEKQ